MASNRSERQEEIRFRMLRLLEENPEMSTRDLANEMGISNGAAYYCLNALVEKGWVKLGNFKRSEHKGRYAYVLTPSGIAERAGLTKRFLARKMNEYEALKAEIEELSDEVSIKDLRGLLKRDTRPKVALEDMDASIVGGAIEERAK